MDESGSLEDLEAEVEQLSWEDKCIRLEEKVLDMQQDIESLQEELRTKELVIQSLTMRVDMSITDPGDLPEKNTSENLEYIRTLLRKTEYVAQTTVLENFNLKDKLKRMENEQVSLQSKIEELSNMTLNPPFPTDGPIVIKPSENRSNKRHNRGRSCLLAELNGR